MKIKFELEEGAILPTHENYTDAGYDIYSIEEVGLFPGERKLIKTGLHWQPIIEMHEIAYFQTLNLGVYADIRERSGNALKKGLTILGGIVDYDYRGSIGVILYNTSSAAITINPGDKIAQIIFTPCFLPYVEAAKKVDETARGSNGFGSSGLAGNAWQTTYIVVR